MRYRAKRDCPIFPELAGILEKTAGLVNLLREALLPLGAAATALVLVSVARGEERAGSVLGAATFNDVAGALAPLHDRLEPENNPVGGNVAGVVRGAVA